MPGAVLDRDRRVGLWMEGDALHVAVSVGEGPGIEALGRGVVRMGVAIGIHPQDLGAHHRGALRDLLVVVVTGGQPERALVVKAHATAVMRARPAEG